MPSARLGENVFPAARQLFMAQTAAWGGLWWLGMVGACKGTACNPLSPSTQVQAPSPRVGTQTKRTPRIPVTGKRLRGGRSHLLRAQ